MAAVRQGLAGGPASDIARAYVAWMARRQIEGGAAFLDLNVDEIDPDVEGRREAMTWLVEAVGPVSSVPLSIDSSDAAVLEAGLDHIDPAWAGGARPMVNSASVERPAMLDVCRKRGTSVVLSCTGTSMPSGTADRLERAEEIVGLAQARGLAPSALYVDALIIPIGVDPMAGSAYLDAVRGSGSASVTRSTSPAASPTSPSGSRRGVSSATSSSTSASAPGTTAASSIPSPRTSRPPWRPTATPRRTGSRPPC